MCTEDFRIRLKKEMVVLENLHTLDSTAADSNAKGKKAGSTTACTVNSCQGKDAGVLFRLNYSIHQLPGIGCDTSS